MSVDKELERLVTRAIEQAWAESATKERARWEVRLQNLKKAASEFGPHELGLPAGLRLAIEIMTTDGWPRTT